MVKPVSIDPVQRLIQRDPEEARSELDFCTLDFLDRMEKLARVYPGAVAVGSICLGSPSVLAFTVSDDDGVEVLHCQLDALDRARVLAWIIARLPEEVLAAFEIQLNHEKEVAAIKAGQREAEGEHND